MGKGFLGAGHTDQQRVCLASTKLLRPPTGRIPLGEFRAGIPLWSVFHNRSQLCGVEKAGGQLYRTNTLLKAAKIDSWVALSLSLC